MNNKVIKVKEIFENVYELPIYTLLSYKEGFARAASNYDCWSSGGCSAVCKVCGGHTLIGRNMDLTISNKPAYIIKTSPKGLLKTIGLTYFDKFGENSEKIALCGGLDPIHYEYAPFLCCDILNEKGFYIEVNMRSTEYEKDGKSKFGCSGTNLKSKTRICASLLPRYLADRAQSVDDALKIVRDLDIYTPNGSGLDWNLCFMLADSTGKHGILEIACNKVSFVEEDIQTNFYLTKEFNKIEDFKAGVGRFEYLKAHYEGIKNNKTMFDAIYDVSYFQMYFGNCKFDPRTELVGDKPGWTTKFLLDEANRDVVNQRFNDIQKGVEEHLKNRTLKDAEKYWKSIFTVVTDCNAKEMNVRFFENEKFKIKLIFDF